MVIMVNLLPNSEIVGRLSKIDFDGLCVKLIFSIDKEVEIPTDAFSNDELHSYVGKRVGICYLDGEFFIRIIKG